MLGPSGVRAKGRFKRLGWPVAGGWLSPADPACNPDDIGRFLEPAA